MYHFLTKLFLLVIDAVVWEIKYTERNIPDIGLDILYELLTYVGRTTNIS